MAAGRLPDGGRRKIGGTDFCVSCGKPYIITAPAQSYCPECAPIKRTEDRSAYVRVSAGNGPRRLGTTDVCARCGTIYTLTGPRQKYCPKCANALKLNISRRHLGDTATCEMCGAEYTIAAGNQRFCPRCSRVPSAIKRTVTPPRRKPRRRKPHGKTIRDDLDCVPSTFRDLLDRYDITQSRFAEYLGLDVSTVSKWCSGKIACRPYIIAMAAKILSLAADEVRGDAENCKNEEDPT